ncbi:TonB-dependent receptor [Sphingobium baderi]|uniref:TonB-dependent receptor n=1 Tax=Sphingobium baderi TaxID=1332080 RepID=UPI0009DC3775|nr:TonB-dependent receptor [Sphingobium baderi]
MTLVRCILLSGCATLALHGTTAFAQTGNADTKTHASADQAAENLGVQDIVVTARRKEEALSRVPIAVSAFSSETLAKKSITSMDQLTQSTPGLIFGKSGGTTNPQIVIRGQTRANVGDAAQPVLTYFADVPLPYFASILPVYDLASVQVLKGPQGTLFGRNSTSGAVLVYPNAPTYTWGGYLMGGYGNYDNREVEGALNLPIMEDHIALRIAGRRQIRDGYTKVTLPDGAVQDRDNLNDYYYRASLLVEPFDGLKNVTVFDSVKWNRNGDGTIFGNTYPTGTARLFPAAFDCGTSASCDIDLAAARQKTLGVRRGFGDFPIYTNTLVTGLSNTTTLNLGNITLKNILGQRLSKYRNLTDTDGTEMLLTSVNTDNNIHQFSEEFQVQGDFFDNRVHAIAGIFYLKVHPGRPQFQTYGAFQRPGVSLPTSISAYRRSTSKSAFGQVTLDVTSKLKIDLGIRYNKDKLTACSAGYQINAPYLPDSSEVLTEDGCYNGQNITKTQFGVTSTSIVKGTVASAASSATTWNIGVNYQVTPELFVYATARKGYRAGGVNTPVLGGLFLPYQSYGPETVRDYEAGAKWKFNVGGVPGNVNFDIFTGKYKNSQRGINGLAANQDGDGDPLTDPALSTLIVNAGTARVRGFDFDATVEPTRGLTLTGFVSYNAEEYLDNGLAGTPFINTSAFPLNPKEVAFQYAPEWTFGGSMTAEKEVETLGTLALSVDAYHSSRVYFTNDKNNYILSQKPYTTVNGRLDVREILGSKIDLGFYVRNIFKKVYKTGASNSAISSGYDSVFYAEPRMYGAQIRINF